MKIQTISIVTAASILLVGCSKQSGSSGTSSTPAKEQPSAESAATSDAEVSKNLPGAWHVVPSSAEQSGNKIIFTIAPNGDFTRHGVSSDGVHSSLDVAGTLKVQDGYLIETITNSSQRGARLPRVTREEIIRANDHEIVFTVKGMTNQITIQKDTP